MGKLEGTIKFEIMRLAKREVRKISVPLSRDIRLMKSTSMLNIRMPILPEGLLSGRVLMNSQFIPAHT